MFAGASATELSASPGILLAILLTAMSFTCGRDNLTGESGSRAVDHGHGHATLYFTRQVVLPVKMSHRKTFCSKLLTLPDCPITPLGYSYFSLILAGRLPAVTADAPAPMCSILHRRRRAD
jgi:hypothetical protein